MTPEKFEASYKTVAEAPNGIKKLRGLILELAVRGKLVNQQENEESAELLLARNKALVVSTRLGIRNKSQENNGSDSTSLMARFDLPVSWRWTTIASVTSYVQRGKSPNYAERSDVLVVSQKCVQWEGFKLERARFIDSTSVGAYGEERFLRVGDLLWNSTGHGTVGRIAIYQPDPGYPRVVADSHVTIIRPVQVSSRFIWCWIASPTVQRTIDDIVSGTTKQTELATSTVLQHPIPVPPLAEQERIVAKVDQLMALCDDLEARQAKKRETAVRLNWAALDSLTSKEGPDVSTSFRRIAENFEALASLPENVDYLRRTILKIAVRGQLAPQQSIEASAESFLKKVRADRICRASVREGSRNPWIECGSLESDIDSLPSGWALTVIGNAVNCLDYLRRPVNKDERAGRHGEVPYYGANGQVGWIDSYIFDEPLVLVVEDETFVGRTKPFSYKIEGKSWVNNHAHVLQPTCAISVDYLNMALCYYPFIPMTSGTTGRNKLTKADLLRAPIRLPPLAEQARIVTKVDHLMALCDTLEAALRRAESTAQKLAEAVVAEIVA